MSEMEQELSPETPEADAVEQHEDLDDQTYMELPQAPFDANEADAVEQRRSVQLDDDDYR